MVRFLRTTVILTVVVLAFMLTVQARTVQSNECSEPNEAHSFCGNACPTTCGDFLHLNSPKPCTHQCVMGCFCQDGFVRETEEPTSRCVKTNECLSTA